MKASFDKIKAKEQKIGVVGLGYVGLPLANLFAKHYSVIGLDKSERRISELRSGVDVTRELSSQEIKESKIDLTTDSKRLAECSVIIVTVPTPIDDYKMPDLRPLQSSSSTVGQFMQAGTIIVYESTVYPGLTEEICVPILEKQSNLKWKKDFNVAYSPERINPGDKEHTVEKIKKVVAGDTEECGQLINSLYASVIKAGTHLASNIKTAEAAKVIENTQRDLNIALMNELSLIFARMGINTLEVLEAAGTKWNFLNFRPGLVGGHCIGVDPYYLTWKAQSLGYEPEVILAGRKINDNMGRYVAEQTIKRLIKNGTRIQGCRILICGFTFKENVPDIRNTRVIDIYNELLDYGVHVDVYEPIAYAEEMEKEYNITPVKELANEYDAVILAVKHKALTEQFSLDFIKSLFPTNNPIVMDLKGFFSRKELEDQNILVWQL